MKFKYTVHSMEYVGTLTRLRPTGRILPRPPQTLFDPVLRYFGLDHRAVLAIKALHVGETYVDKFGDHWERVA